MTQNSRSNNRRRSTSKTGLASSPKSPAAIIHLGSVPDGGSSPRISPELDPSGVESQTVDERFDAVGHEHPIEKRFIRIGGIRDGLLVCGGIVYVLGRLVWAYHANRFNLGNLSVDQSQYFVAGFVPALIVLLVWLGTRGIQAFLQILAASFVPNASRMTQIFGRLVTTLYVIVGIIFLVLWIGGQRLPGSPATHTVLLLTALCAFMTGLPLFWHVRSNRAAMKIQFEYTDLAMTAVYPVLVGLLSILVFGGFVYPRLSQEYGGALPRVACLDVDRAKISPDTLKALVPAPQIKSKATVVRTIPLDVFFASSEKILVKPYSKWPDNRTYEISAGSVLSRDWLDPTKVHL